MHAGSILKAEPSVVNKAPVESIPSVSPWQGRGTVDIRKDVNYMWKMFRREMEQD